MCRPYLSFPPIPADTAREAKDAIEKNPAYGVLAGEMASLFALCRSDTNSDRAIGEPVQFLRNAMITMLQDVERLTDFQAETATRTRMDWKYTLHLPLNHPGLHAYEFCMFRQKVLSEPEAGELFRAIQERVMALRLWPHLTTESAAVDCTITSVCKLNQAGWFADALRQALVVLAVLQPDWLRQIALPHWYVRYAAAQDEEPGSLPHDEGRLSLESVRQDIAYLLGALALCDDAETNQLPVIRRLRRTSQQICDLCDRRDTRCLFCTQCLVGASIAGGPDLATPLASGAG